MAADDLTARRSTDADLAADPDVSRADAENAERTPILWAGDGPDPTDILCHTFEDTDGYDGMVLLRDIGFECRSERGATPILGVVHVAYLPNRRVVGIPKLARVVDACARRSQLQEQLTVQIAKTIDVALRPKGIAVAVEARHHAAMTRGVPEPGTTVTTSRMLGVFRNDPDLRREFHMLIGWRS